MQPADVTIDDIAGAMGIPPEELWGRARNMDRSFLPPVRKSVNGKTREIDRPRRDAKRLLRKLHRFLQRKIGAHPAVHGGARHRSCFTSARLHLNQKYVISRDVKDCYPSITESALKARLLKLGFRADISLLLSLLLTLRGRIPQGSPTSSDALNLFLFDADRALHAASRRVGARYGRTYDDMIISVGSADLSEWPGDAMRRQIESHDLKINAKKLHNKGFQPRHREQRVHNLIVNSGRGVRIPSEQSQYALSLAESYRRGARAVSAESLEGLAYKRAQVWGWLQHCRQADYGPARPIRRLLDAADAQINRKLSSIGLMARRGNWWLYYGRNNETSRLARAWSEKREMASAVMP